jgi:beta-ureidopropionase
MIEVAALEGANIICLQEIFNAPFFMCTRERYPWVEFSESMEG